MKVVHDGLFGNAANSPGKPICVCVFYVKTIGKVVTNCKSGTVSSRELN